MGNFGGYYKGEKRKFSKEELARKTKKGQKIISPFKLPELIRKKRES